MAIIFFKKESRKNHERIMVSNNLVLFFVVFKFISIVIGNFGNIIIIIYTIFVSKEKTGTIILGWQWQMFSCAYNFIQYE